MADPTEASIIAQETIIGQRAAKKVQTYLDSVISQKLKKGTSKGAESLEKGTKVKFRMGEHRLLGLNLSGPVHGYILNYGFVGVREATSVYFSAPRYNLTKTQRSRHPFNLPAKEIFEEIYNKSGVIPFLVEELGKTRIAAVEIRINDMVLQFNKDQDGR